MELRCAILCSIVSFVIATPHGYGTKGGAAARAQAGATASAFSGISGLPLSIPDGAVSGSFSKSSSSSFASSSASSSSGSFSFSGSGAAGLSGFLGLPGNSGCKSGGCQSGNGINIPQEISPENGISSYSGAHAASAAGAIAGVQNGAGSPCSGNNCYAQKLPCEGKDCKDFVGPINASKKCSSGQCNAKSEFDSSVTSSDICAKGQCRVNQSSQPTPVDFSDIKECTSGSCSTDTGSEAPSKNYDSNDVSGGTSDSSSLTSNNEPSKGSSVDCSHGNCGSSAQNSKPLNNYPIKPNPDHLDSKSPSVQPTTLQQDNKSTSQIAGDSSSTPGSLKPNDSYQNQHTTCVGEHCDNESIFKSPTNIQGSNGGINCVLGNCASNPSSNPTDINKPGSNVSSGSSIIAHPKCNSGKCDSIESSQRPDFDLSGSKSPKYPEATPVNSDECVSGNCASHSSQSSYLSSSGSESKAPSYSPGAPSTDLTNCASGNCGAYPSGQYPGSTDSKSQTPTHPESLPSRPGSCASGNCAGYPYSRPTNYDNSALEPNVPNHNYTSPPRNCASGNCGPYPSIPYPGFDTSEPQNPTHSTGVSDNPNCASGNCPSSLGVGFSTTGPKLPTYLPGTPSSGSPNCAFGTCGSFPSSQNPGFGTLGQKSSTYPTAISSSSSNCASGNCATLLPGPGFSTTKPKSPSYTPGSSSDGSPNCASGNCAPYPSNPHPSFDTSGQKNPTYSAGSSSPSNCASGSCGNFPSVAGFSTTGPKTPAYSPGASSSTASNCALGNCGSYLSSQYLGFHTPGSKTPTYPEISDNNSASCTYGNCAKVPSTRPNEFSGTETKFPSGFSPSSQHPGFSISGSETPTYVKEGPGISNCASGNCANVPLPGHIGQQIPNDSQGIQSSGSPNCAFGNCDTKLSSPYPGFDTTLGHNPSKCVTGNCESVPSGSTELSSTGYKIPSITHKIPSGGLVNCASGNCGSYPHGQYPNFGTSAPSSYAHESAGSKFPAHSQESLPSGSKGCPLGNCNIPSLQSTGVQTASKVPSHPAESFPAFVPLAPTNSPHAIGSPSTTFTHESEPINSAVNPVSTSGIVGGVHSSSSIFDTSKSTFKKDQIYTGGFGGPPGILNPYEFKSPPPGGYYSTTNNKPSPSSSCSSGNCASHPGSNSVNNRPEILGNVNPVSCGSGKCDSHTNSPNYSQYGASNAVFTAAATTSKGTGAVYTGGFGGPPGLLKPYDDGKVTSSSANIFEKASIGPQSSPGSSPHGIHGTPSNKLNNFGAQAVATASASAGAYSSGNHAEGNEGLGGCGGGCGSSGSRSLGGSFGLSGNLELPKTGPLNYLNGGVDAARAAAKSIAATISGTGANSFGLGGSFARSSAHAASGATTKGDYGR